MAAESGQPFSDLCPEHAEIIPFASLLCMCRVFARSARLPQETDHPSVCRGAIFSEFGRNGVKAFCWGSPDLPASQLAKTLHTERHRKLRELLVAKRKSGGLDANRARAALG